MWFLMEVTCSLINKHAVYCGFLDLLYQVEQVLFLEFLIFFNIERMLAFIKLFFLSLLRSFFFFQDLGREVRFLLLKVNLIFYHFRIS